MHKRFMQAFMNYCAAATTQWLPARAQGEEEHLRRGKEQVLRHVSSMKVLSKARFSQRMLKIHAAALKRREKLSCLAAERSWRVSNS